MGSGKPPVGDQIGARVLIVGGGVTPGVTDTAERNGRDQFSTKSSVEVAPFLRRGPTGIAGEAATVETVGCVYTQCQDREEGIQSPHGVQRLEICEKWGAGE